MEFREAGQGGRHRPTAPPPGLSLTAGCSGPSVCSRICRASCRRSVASLYLFWSLWGTPRMEGVSLAGPWLGLSQQAQGPGRTTLVAPFRGPLWVSPHLPSPAQGLYTPRSLLSLWPPQVSPILLGSLLPIFFDSSLPRSRWPPQTPVLPTTSPGTLAEYQDPPCLCPAVPTLLPLTAPVATALTCIPVPRC